MQHARDNPSLPFAAEIGPEDLPERLNLILPDGYATGIYHHRPRGGAARLPVLYAHGIQSHPGWFVGSAAALAKRGRPVFQATRRGSGLNRAARGGAKSARQLLDDTRAACRFVLDQTGFDALHLLGASWGGKLLAAHAITGDEHVASLTLAYPGIATKVDVSARTKAAIGLSLLFCPRRKFDIPLSDAELFTDNHAKRQYLRNDQYRLQRATARFMYASYRLDRMLAKAPRGAIKVPTTLILSRRDRIIDNRATCAIVERLTAGRCSVKEFDSAHTIDFEPDPFPYYDFLARTLEEHET